MMETEVTQSIYDRPPMKDLKPDFNIAALFSLG